jgi:hypothetical protein
MAEEFHPDGRASMPHAILDESAPDIWSNPGGD